MPGHYRLVEEPLAGYPEGYVHGVHVKGDSNANADNAHVLALIKKRGLRVLLGKLHYRWELPGEVLNALLTACGLERGTGHVRSHSLLILPCIRRCKPNQSASSRLAQFAQFLTVQAIWKLLSVFSMRIAPSR